MVANIDGVAYINDSKGTNVDATIKAIDAMKADTVLLLGGKDKGYNYEKLFAALSGSKVVHAILYGENRFTLLKAARACDYHAVTLCDGFDFAVRIAALKAQTGQNVLLSPASASFDEFANYEERGEAFVTIVQSLIKKQEENAETEVFEVEVE
jgi:UDP-N-acetylmuramoylalanine--D-glutamate ligase